MKSVIDNGDYCLICGAPAECEHHLIEGTANRAKSEQYGLKIPLCNTCHNMNANSMHGNTKMARLGKIIGQIAFEREYFLNAIPSDDKETVREEARVRFRQEFGKTYL